MGKREKKLIGIICPEPESETYGMIVGCIEKILSDEGAEVLIGITRFDRVRKADVYSMMIYQAKADGIIVIGSGADLKNPDKIPTVSITEGNEYASSESEIAVNIKNTMEELVLFLKKESYRRVGFIGEKLTESRLEAFKSAMRKEGLPLLNDYIYISNSSRFADAGVEGMSSFIKNSTIPEVFFTAYDNIAFGAMKTAKENGLKVPDDVSFIGINDISPSEYMDVPLSSIETNYAETAKAAADLILSQIKNKYGTVKKRCPVISARLNLRKSLKTKNEK